MEEKYNRYRICHPVFKKQIFQQWRENCLYQQEQNYKSNTFQSGKRKDLLCKSRYLQNSRKEKDLIFLEQSKECKDQKVTDKK